MHTCKGVGSVAPALLEKDLEARAAVIDLSNTAAGFGCLARLSFSRFVAYRPRVPSRASVSSSTKRFRLLRSPPGDKRGDTTAAAPTPKGPSSLTPLLSSARLGLPLAPLYAPSLSEFARP
eukprot:scaffold96148_cov32-Tisochrysis_lutea.AAC.3